MSEVICYHETLFCYIRKIIFQVLTDLHRILQTFPIKTTNESIFTDGIFLWKMMITAILFKWKIENYMNMEIIRIRILNKDIKS